MIANPIRLGWKSGLRRRALAEVGFAGPRAVAHPFNDGVGLILTKVATETEPLDPHRLRRPRHYGAEVLECAIRLPLQVMRIER